MIFVMSTQSTDCMKRLAWVLCFAISLYHSLTLDLLERHQPIVVDIKGY